MFVFNEWHFRGRTCCPSMFYLILRSVFETFQRSLWPCHAQKGLSLSLADSGGKELPPCCGPPAVHRQDQRGRVVFV